MRRRIFFTVCLSLFAVVFGANAADVRANSRRSVVVNDAKQDTAATSTSAARAATVRGAVKNTNTNANAAGTARSAVKRGTAQTTSAPFVSARAASTQKVINTGTKVATATANTNVPQECQDAFFGCMDAFCMLDNASGGRCQCSNRIVELDQALEDILKLDEQTYLMATEGVERIQMGEGEEQIMARAKAAAEKTVNQDKDDNKKRARTLDLSAWNNNIFTDTDDLFESSSSDSISAFADKKGDDLYKASAKMCEAQVPNMCKSYGSMMQLIYAQRIKSDCIAYENSLKAQKNQSQQKLQAAQKALRDAALDEYKNQNKYATTGECVVAFTQCMQTTAECGDDYTGCVTLAAKENVSGNKNGKAAKQTTIKGVVSGADITLAASTMEQLTAKKVMCEHITKQCVNANRDSAVWNAFLRNAAPALKSAEEVAEQRLRMECIPNIAKCFQEACKSNFGDGDSYDMCLSNPLTYKSLCKVQLEPCLAATGGTYQEPQKSTLWNGLMAMLDSLKVDACTKEVKDCLTSDNACGEDYAACVGLSTDSIMNFCPVEKLTACMSTTTSAALDGDVREYVARVAQGLALQIDNKMLLTCQAALDTAMINVCGDTASCPNATLSSNAVTELLRVQICKEDQSECHDDAYAFKESDVLGGRVGVYITNRPDLSAIDYTLSGVSMNNNNLFSAPNDADDPTLKIKDILNASWKAKVAQLEADPKVSACISGRNISESGNRRSASGEGFANLTQSAKLAIASDLMNRLREDYDDAVTKLNREQVPVMTQKLAEVIENEESKNNVINERRCQLYTAMSQSQPNINGCQAEYRTISAEYNSTSHVCTVRTTLYKRHLNGKKENKTSCDCGAACKFVVEETKEDTYNMSSYSRFEDESQQKLRR